MRPRLSFSTSTKISSKCCERVACCRHSHSSCVVVTPLSIRPGGMAVAIAGVWQEIAVADCPSVDTFKPAPRHTLIVLSATALFIAMMTVTPVTQGQGPYVIGQNIQVSLSFPDVQHYETQIAAVSR